MSVEGIWNLSISTPIGKIPASKVTGERRTAPERQA